eukprot:m.49898 g.49898  ORF g.49898 m.49898 type:complete len:446 (-) comp12511_c0_seq1:390-1727(-)
MNSLNVPALLAKKRDGLELTEGEILAFVKAVVAKQVGLDQVGAFLMATYIRGMNEKETAALTNALMQSGETIKWTDLDASEKAVVVDKHSTGGVGDKVSLPLAPALVACGCKVPMIAGRGLGHTGGTLDKLESIPGYSIKKTPIELAEIVTRVGGCIVGQSETLVPGDRILYHTRDVTSTIDSLPLIVASIMSKKMSESLAALVLDVKVGEGAFMDTLERGRALATAMVAVGKELGVSVRGLLTEMDCPIGYMIGNALEVAESVDCLNGGGPEDLKELVCLQGGNLLHQVGLAATPEEGAAKIAESLQNGSARTSFKAMAAAVGASEDTLDLLFKDPWSVLPQATNKTPVIAEASGYVKHIKSMPLAIAARNLGAGRKKQDDILDLAAGLQLHVARGDHVAAGDAWITIHHDIPILPEDLKAIKGCLVLSTDPVEKQSRLIGVIE